MTSSTPHGPLHVLMALPPAEQKHYLSNQRIEQDCITRRAKAHGIANTTPPSVWNGVSKTEYALIQCCELNETILQEEMEVVMFGGSSNTPLLGGGALDMEHEVRFAGILARSCHDLATRSLALAILERTLETHLIEEAEAKVRLGTGPSHNQEGESQTEANNNDNNNNNNNKEGASDDNEQEEKDESTQAGQKRRSHRLQRLETKYKRTKRKEEDTKNTFVKDQGKTFDLEKWVRLEQFFAAGGLRILNRWLQEASENEIVLASMGNRTKVQPSSTRSLILPLLRFLERIPFDKKLVVDSKINKQIRSIEKQVEKIIEARRNANENPEFCQGWTTSKSNSDTNALELVREAVEQVKKSWGVNAKKEKQTFGDPFASIKESIRERMEALVDFDRGAAPRPEWLDEEPKKVSAPKKSRSELAAKERQAEAEIRKHLAQDLQNKLREAEKRHREHLAKLREKRNMMMLANEPVDIKKKSGGRRVQWKDGMKTKSSRNRKVLEEVYIFDKRTPANKELAHLTGEDDREVGPELSDTTDSLLEPEDSKVPSTETSDVIDLTL